VRSSVWVSGAHSHDDHSQAFVVHIVGCAQSIALAMTRLLWLVDRLWFWGNSSLHVVTDVIRMAMSVGLTHQYEETTAVASLSNLWELSWWRKVLCRGRYLEASKEGRLLPSWRGAWVQKGIGRNRLWCGHWLPGIIWKLCSSNCWLVFLEEASGEFAGSGHSHLAL
jgi:hypothetical protein